MTVVVGSGKRTAVHLWKYLHRFPATTSVSGLSPGCRQLSSLEPEKNKRLDGKVAIITGAAGGIGAEASRHFAAHGAQVIMADVTDGIGEKKASEIGSNALYRHCDVTKEEDVASTVDFAVEKFGKLDIMFNNAGVITPVEFLETFDIDSYDGYNAIMVRGVLAGIKHAARVMIPEKQGVILNTASVAAELTSGNFPLAYNICKSNLPGITKIAAYHLGKHGIRVNAISPHAIPTPLVLEWLNREGKTAITWEELEGAFIKASTIAGKRTTEQDVAKGALFLCSEDSGYISGQNLVVDGGWCSSKDYKILP
ncbi:unnamed protein product [Calypogeia fissa]